MSCCKETATPTTPAGVVVLVRCSTECCLVYCLDGVVYKRLRPLVRPADIQARAALAATHPDIFAPITYDAATCTLTQPYVAGRPATDAELTVVAARLAARGELRVYDLSPTNVLVGADGPRVVDFAFDVGRRSLQPGINKYGRKGIRTVGALTKAQMRTLHWKV